MAVVWPGSGIRDPPPQPPFWGDSSASLHVFTGFTLQFSELFGAILWSKAFKNVTQFEPKRLSKVPSVARQMPAKCIFGHKNALCLSVADYGWAGGFPARIPGTACLRSVATSW